MDKQIIDFLKTPRKYINGWSVTREDGWGKPGDVSLSYYEGEKRFHKEFYFANDWYFYIKQKDTEEARIMYDWPGKRFKEGKEWTRVYFKLEKYRDKTLVQLINDMEKNGIRTYEADLGPMKRVALDYNLQIEDWEKIRILYFDIETDDTIDGLEIGRDHILSLAGVDREGKEYFIYDPDEKKLLLKIDEFIQNFDMLIGWNSKDFDIPYMRGRKNPKNPEEWVKGRYQVHKIPTFYLANVLHEDMQKRVQYFYSKDPEARQKISSYSLNSISQYFGVGEKIPFKSKVKVLHDTDFEKFKSYNIQDCKLLKLLEDKLGTIELTYKMFQWCQVFPQNWSMVKTIDNYILSDANKKGVHYPTNLQQMLKGEEDLSEGVQYLGALVLDPKPGLYENVYDLDFKSLYPNIIRTFNISPETVTDREPCLNIPRVYSGDKVHGGEKYRKDKRGIIPDKIELLLDQRKKIRDKMKLLDKKSSEWNNLNVQQLIVKEMANSIYGVLGNKYFRCFSIKLAESITATGQYLIRYVKEINEKEGRQVIYGDTDSIFLVTKNGERIEDVLEWINSRITGHLKKFGVEKNYTEMALDVKFDRFLIEAKKKYVGKIGDSYKYIGMECVKRDTIPVAVNYQKKLIERLMSGETLPKIKKWVEEKKNLVATADYKMEDLVLRKRISKKIDSYKSDLIHVRIAKELEKRRTRDDKMMGGSTGVIIQYIITNGGKVGEKIDGIPICDYNGKWDRLYYWSNVIYPPLKRLLITVYPKEDWDQYEIKKQRRVMDKLKK
jgi:DNA polymerase I